MIEKCSKYSIPRFPTNIKNKIYKPDILITTKDVKMAV
jgi:hypothetical protein